LARGAVFEQHAAVTELFFCASANCTRLPPVRSECADRYFEQVLRLVAPRFVVCVGARVFRYFRDRYGRAGGAIRLEFGEGAAYVVRMPHPNAWMSEAARQREIGAGIAEIRGVDC
jgi:uracil-DNA glycosylase